MAYSTWFYSDCIKMRALWFWGYLVGRPSVDDGLYEDAQISPRLPGLVPLQTEAQAGWSRVIQRDLKPQPLPPVLRAPHTHLLPFLRERRWGGGGRGERKSERKVKRGQGGGNREKEAATIIVNIHWRQHWKACYEEGKKNMFLLHVTLKRIKERAPQPSWRVIYE